VIERDRALLARMTAVNTAMGEVVVAMLAHQDGGELNSADLREVGERLRQLGVDMRARADELDRHPVIENLWFQT